MRPCLCSNRALELFLKDIAGVNIGRFRPKTARPPQRTLSTGISHRQPAIVVTPTESNDSFLPRDGLRFGNALIEEKQPSAAQLDQAWDADNHTHPSSTQTLTEDAVVINDSFEGAEDVALTPEAMVLKAGAKKVKGLERKKTRKLEGRFAPLTKQRNAAARAKEIGNCESTDADATSQEVKPYVKRQRLRRERARSSAKSLKRETDDVATNKRTAKVEKRAPRTKRQKLRDASEEGMSKRKARMLVKMETKATRTKREISRDAIKEVSSRFDEELADKRAAQSSVDKDGPTSRIKKERIRDGSKEVRRKSVNATEDMVVAREAGNRESLVPKTRRERMESKPQTRGSKPDTVIVEGGEDKLRMRSRELAANAQSRGGRARRFDAKPDTVRKLRRASPRETTASDGKSTAQSRFKPKDREVWQTQKASLERKFGKQGWQPRKRLSPDTLEGIRALHNSDTGAYNTETLAKHFQITPEAIRRILKSKWRPNEDEAEDRRQRWEKRGVKKWKEMAELGMEPPSKWKALGAVGKKQTAKKAKRTEMREKQRHDNEWLEDDALKGSNTFAARIL